MTEKDFFKSMTPYNFSPNVDQDEFFEKFGSRVFKIIDVNGDGVLDFSEYFFFVVMLGLTNTVAKGLFEEYSVNGQCSKKQFSHLLNEARKMSNQGKQVTEAGALPDPRSTSALQSDFDAATKNITK